MANLGLSVVVGIFISMVFTLFIITVGFELINKESNIEY